MNPLEVDLNKEEYTDDELEALGKSMLLVKKLQENAPLLRAVEKYMSKQSTEIKSLADLRKKSALLSESDTGDEE